MPVNPIARTTSALVFRGCFVVFALAISGCGGDEASLPKLSSGDVVVAFGDSLTFGTGARREQSYPAVLESRTGLRVVNAGVPGEVTEQGLRRLPKVLAQHKPKLVVLCHGGNDMLRKKGIKNAEANLREMIRLIRESGAAVVMLGVPDPGLFLSTADFYERVAEDLGVPIDTEIIPDLLGDNEFKSDHIHPNGKGYVLVAEAVEALLKKHGAL